jgi:hypothetical protein
VVLNRQTRGLALPTFVGAAQIAQAQRQTHAAQARSVSQRMARSRVSPWV